METIGYQEGQVIYKKRKRRLIIALVVIILTLFITPFILLSYLGEAYRGYKTIEGDGSAAPPVEGAKLITGDPLLGYGLYSVPLSIEERQKDLQYGYSFLAAGIILIILAVLYTLLKDRFIYKNGKLIIDPEWYLRTTAIQSAVFGFVMATYVLYLKLFTPQLNDIGFTSVISLYLGSFIYYLIYKANIKLLTFFWKLGIALTIITFIFDAITRGKIDMIGLIVGLLVSYHFYRKATEAIKIARTTPAV